MVEVIERTIRNFGKDRDPRPKREKRNLIIGWRNIAYQLMISEKQAKRMHKDGWLPIGRIQPGNVPFLKPEDIKSEYMGRSPIK